jgi:tyrosine-protein kinase Etk/Wzc
LLAASGAMSTAQTLGVNLPGMAATPADIFISILKSRTMADDVVKRFHLLDRYEVKFMQDARTRIEGVTRFEVTKEKVTKIMVEDKDPVLAAEMANFPVAHPDHLNRTKGVSKASENRKFVEGRLKETEEKLVKAEEALKEFQAQNRTGAIEAQSKAMVEAAETIQAQIMAQKVQLQVMGSYLSADNPEVARVQSSINKLRKELHSMESGKGGKDRLPGDRLRPAITTVPALALEYGRLARDLKVQETLYALVVSQYEQAKLTEARDTPTVQVLDPAIPAEKKSRPKISLNLLIAGMLSLLMSIFWAFFREALNRR